MTQTHYSERNGTFNGEPSLYTRGAGVPSLSRLLSGSRQGVSIFPKVTVTRSTDAIHVTAYVPGVEKSELELSIEDQYLTVSGNRILVVSDEEVLADERFYGNFQRVVKLPEAVDAERVEAKHENGVLRVVLPRLKQNRKTQVEIQ